MLKRAKKTQQKSTHTYKTKTNFFWAHGPKLVHDDHAISQEGKEV